MVCSGVVKTRKPERQRQSFRDDRFLSNLKVPAGGKSIPEPSDWFHVRFLLHEENTGFGAGFEPAHIGLLPIALSI
jgi:hypothetical protein